MTKETNMRHRPLTKQEEEQAFIAILDVLLDKSLPFSGKHRKRQWERGWAENLRKGDIVPRYFGKHGIQRRNGRLVMALDGEYERDMLYSLVDSLARKYMSKASDVYEFGCGTGHNLLRVRKANRDAVLHGLDWTESSGEIVKKLGFEADRFDYFRPDYGIVIRENSAVYTVASLEQTGTDYRKFVKYLLANRPKVVVHIEPIPELLDPSVLLDYLSIRYMEKRKYLSGYLTYLRSLEKKGKLKILEARRSGIGSFLIDGYSIIVWKPS